MIASDLNGKRVSRPQAAIANATSLAEVERLKGMLQAGQIPGREGRQGNAHGSQIPLPLLWQRSSEQNICHSYLNRFLNLIGSWEDLVSPLTNIVSPNSNCVKLQRYL